MTPTRLKLVAALLLLASLALPLASCSRYEDAEGNRVRVAEGEEPPAGVHRVVERTYALEGFDPLELESWLVLAAFTWPLAALAARRLLPSGFVAGTVRLLELPLVAGSFFLIEFLATFLTERREIGAWVAFAALALYAAAAVWDDVRWWRGRRAARAARVPSGGR